jgi:serine/threonine protein kinase
MTAVVKPLPGTEDTLSTGVRRTPPVGGAAGAAPAVAETMSGHRQYPLESWDPDEEPESELPIPAGELLGGKYTVDGMFAGGGMGIVCLGRHVRLDQPVAIKFLRRTLSGRASIVERFLNEGRALAALRSEHVVRVMDVGQLDSGRPYLVMEHLDGIHLEALLERDGPLSIETAISYALQVCEPLGEAHALGIVHRDIKPENLFLWSGGPNQDTVKVLDFGLAKQLGSSKALGVTGPQDSLGSPCYMSPEQITTPHLIDSRTDIWSLGVVLYRFVSNTLPFGGDSLVEVLSHILNATPRSLTEVRPHVDAELDAIVFRCLERSPEARYQTMAQLADALNAYLAARTGATPDSEREAAPVVRSRRPAASRDSKILIPGVRSRWPVAIVALLLLVGAATYQADQSGPIRLRNLTDGWLTAARIGTDALSPTERRGYDPLLPQSRASTLRAAPERELTANDSLAEPAVTAPMSAEDVARKEAIYSDYLKSQGLTRLPELEKPSNPYDQP